VSDLGNDWEVAPVTRSPEIETCVIGAGMSGLLMGIRLQGAAKRFRIIEKATSVGGTWRENTYPGLTCDVPSFFYCYSFEPNLDWSHRFSPGPEIRAYFERVAEKYDIVPHITFGQTITSARFEDGRWSIETSAGECFRADVLVDATGPLHIKNYPEIQGLESFEGAMFHSADWDHGVPLEGRRIGVIGNGSTGVQMMEPLSDLASHLTMFQRTAGWIFPVGNRRYTERERAWTRRLPILGRLTREVYKWLFDHGSVGVTQDGYWRRQMSRGCRKYLATVADPELRRKLTPDHEPGCKRLIFSTTFYTTLQKEHVDLVTEGIDYIEPRGVVTEDGQLHELDVLVLATGFRAHDWGIDDVVGVDGLSLKDAWERGPRTYRSVTMPGFPNFFMLVGPNSPIGNISIIDVSETQTRYILDCIQRLDREHGKALVPKRQAAEAFQKDLREAMKGTIWVTGCKSWYLDPDGVPTLWPWSASHFHEVMRRPDFSDFDLIDAT
jgi:cation diffusion facilitator CzcD-associated flavoprotein CzcO